MICSILYVQYKMNSVEGMIMNILEYLERSIVDKHSLDDLISAFEEMCIISIEEETEKMILFETGTFSFTGRPMFYFSLVRQYPNEEEEYYQLHLDIMFEPTHDNSSYEQVTWSFEIEDNIFDYIRKSKEYICLKEVPIARIDVYMDET